MASNYPDSFDSLDDPAATDPLSNPAHAALHVSENDAIEAVQATLGLNPEGSYATVAERMGEVDTAAAAAQAAQVAAELAQAAAEGAATDAGDAANLAEDWAVQLVDPVSGGEYSAKYHAQAAASSAEDAADRVVEANAAAAGAFTALGNANAQVTASRQARRFGADGSVLTNLPMQVDPAEDLLKQAVWWIDAAHSSASGQTVSNLGWGGSALDAQVGSTTGADSNDPKYLDWQGENYVYLPGVAGNYLSVPDEAALDITGDIDIRVKVAQDSVSGTEMALVSKDNGTVYTYTLRRLAGGTLNFLWADSGGGRQVTSSTSPISVAGEAQWLRVTLDVDNGAGGHEVKFWTSPDGSSWSQVGTTQNAGAFTTSILASTYTTYIGSRTGTVANAAGKVYRAIIKNGIDGPTVLDIDCSRVVSGSDTSFTARTGQVVTVNRSSSGRKSCVVTQPVWLFGTDDYMEVADNDLIDFGASDSFTVLAVVRQWATPFNFSYPFGKHNDGVAGYYLRNNGTGTSRYAGISDGTNQAITTADYVDYTLGQVSVAGIRLDRSSQELSSFNGSDISTAASTSAVGSLANSLTFRVGNRSAGGFFTDAEFTAAAIFRRALTPAEIRILNDYYQGNGYEPISPAKYTNEAALPVDPEPGTLVFNQQSEQLLLQQGGSWSDVVTAKSVLRVLPEGEPAAEKLLRQAVWWIDANEASAGEQTVSNLGWGGSALDARLGSASGADSNDPVFLDFDGTPYVYTNGPSAAIASDCLRVDDASDLRLTADFEMIFRVRAVDWTPASQSAFGGKDNTSTTRGYSLILNSTGTLGLRLSSAGTDATTTAVNSTAAVPFADGDTGWVRVTFKADNGSAGNDATFYTAPDSPTVPSSWTQLGATVTTAGVAVIAANAAPFTFGYCRGGSINWLGRLHRCIVKNGINGTPVLDIDCSQITSGSNTSFTALTGQTVTINRSTSGRKAVAVTHPCWLFGTDDYMEVPARWVDAPSGGLFLPGLSGNYASTPDSAALQVTGDLTIDVELTLDSSTRSEGKILLQRWVGGGGQSYMLMLNTTGTLYYAWSTTGSDSVAKNSTVAISAGTQWVRVCHDVDNGATQNEVKFYTSDDGSVWSQLGSTVTTAGVTSRAAGWGKCVVGATEGGYQAILATVYRARIYASADGSGSPVFDADFTGQAALATTFTEDSTNAATVTVNTSGSGYVATLVPASGYVQPTGVANYQPSSYSLLDFGADDSFTVLGVIRNWTTNAEQPVISKRNRGSASSAAYSLNTNSSGSPSIVLFDLANNPQPSVSALPTALTVATGVRNAASRRLSIAANGSTAEATDTTGSLVNPNPVQVGRYFGNDTRYASYEFYAAAIWRRALTSGELATLNTYFQGREGA